MKHALTYDDIQLVPAYSDIDSRQSISLKTKLSKNLSLLTPLVAAPMDTVCDYTMAYSLFTFGGAGCIHRFMSSSAQAYSVKLLGRMIYGENGEMHTIHGWELDQRVPIVAAIGVNPNEDKDRAKELVEAGANALIIDVAHGHHKKVIDMIKWCKDTFGEQVDIIAGNIATPQAAVHLEEAGADGLRVGIGGGSLCTTRIQTGFGIPNFSCIDSIQSVAKTPIMADGGIRSSGDIAKALAAGAQCVMIGSLLAGTDEAPGEIMSAINGLYKKYRGSASLETKTVHNKEARNIEGESTLISYKGKSSLIINSLLDGVKSALSYAGSTNLNQFAPQFVVVTQAGQKEAKPHLLF